MLPFQAVSLTEAELNEFGIYGGQGMRLLGFSDESEAPETVVKTLRTYIDEWDPDLVRDEREFALIVMCLGTVWGHQVTLELGWDWLVLEQEGLRSYAIVSPDRAYATHPTVIMGQYLRGMRDNTSLLLFNMLRAGNLPESSPNQFLGIG